MATVVLCSGVYQDGGQFYIDHNDGETELIADYGYLVADDADVNGANAARWLFAELNPEYAYVDRERTAH